MLVPDHSGPRWHVGCVDSLVFLHPNDGGIRWGHRYRIRYLNGLTNMYLWWSRTDETEPLINISSIVTRSLEILSLSYFHCAQNDRFFTLTDNLLTELVNFSCPGNDLNMKLLTHPYFFYKVSIFLKFSIVPLNPL